MAIDPSIFFQGAQLRQQNDAQTRATIGSFFDKLAASREGQIPDIEKGAMAAIYKQEAGLEPTAQEKAAFGAWQKLRSTEQIFDPATQNVIPKYNMGVFDTLSGAQAQPYQSPWTPPSAGPEDMGAIPAMDEGLLSGAYPPMDNVPSPPMGGMMPMGDNRAEIMDRAPVQGMPMDGLPSPQNPKQAQDFYGAQLDIAKEKAKNRQSPIQAKSAIQSVIDQNKNIDETIDEAIKMTGPLTSGFASQFQYPGTPAANLKAILDTISADAAFSTLQQIRDSSPTGGALGAISEKELDLLKSSVASIQQAQSPGQLKKQLQKYKLQRAKSLNMVKKAYQEQYGELPDQGVGSNTDFNSPEEAEAANLPPGTMVTIGGRMAVVE